MKLTHLLFNFCLGFLFASLAPAFAFENDVINTDQGPLVITFIKHGSLMFEFSGKTIYIDPVLKMGDYQNLPKADLIAITHGHGDHLDPKAIELLATKKTRIIMPPSVHDKGLEGLIMKNGAHEKVAGIEVEAVPAYNIVHKRDNGEPFHPKGRDNGYIFNFGGTRVYVAGDTENIPEMKALTDIDIAFLPMNLPYTMTPEMVADAVFCFQPAALYPYHFGDSDTAELVDILKDQQHTEVRIRPMP